MTPDIPRLRELMAMAPAAPWTHAPCSEHPGANYDMPCWLVRGPDGRAVGSHDDRDFIAAVRNALPAILDRLALAEAVCVAAMVYEAAVDAELSQSVKQRRMFDALATWRQAMSRE